MAEEKSKEEKHKAQEHSEANKKFNCKKFLKNYWAIASVLLALLLIAVLLYNSFTTISASTAGQKVIDFVNENSQGQYNATLNSISSKGSLYEVVITIQDQQMPVYITKDGKNLIPPTGLIPLESEKETNTNTNSQSTEVPKNDKPVVELFVMSYCPYGTQMEKGIIPVVNLLKDKIDFELKFVYYAMHPSYGEVEENTRQYCIQKEQKDKFISYLTCFLTDGKSSECLVSTGIDTAKLNACVSAADKEFNIAANKDNKDTWLSGQFPMYNVNLEDNQKYSVGGSPTLVVNGVEVSTGRDSQSLLNQVCAAFTTAPSECSQTLSSTTPSSGFGFDSSGTDTTAQCG